MVDDDGGFVGCEAHFFDTPAKGLLCVFLPFESVFFLVFVVEVKIHEGLAGAYAVGEACLGGDEGDVGQVTFEVFCVTLAVLGMVQDGVDVVEYVPFGGLLAVFGLELFEGPVGDVFAAVGAVFGIGVVGETLGWIRVEV